jgi:hypothetical protein
MRRGHTDQWGVLVGVGWKVISNIKVGCLHPVARTRSGSGFPSNATLV